MKVAVIGSDSFIASRIIGYLLTYPSYIITGFGRDKRQIIHNNYTCHKFYFPDYPLDYKALLDYNAIIIAVSAGVQSNSKTEEEQVIKVNYYFQRNIFEYLQQNEYGGKVITFGSYFEIGNNLEERYFDEKEVVESKRTTNGSFYIKSKRMFTRYVYLNTFAFQNYHLVLCTVYGKGENERRLIPYIVNAIKTSSNISLTNGKQIRQYLHVSDLNRLIDCIIRGNYSSGIYNVSNPKPIRINELVKYLLLNDEKKVVSVKYDAPRIDVSMECLLVSNIKAVSTFGWLPNLDIEYGVKEYFDN